MNQIRQIQELNKRELEAGVSPNASWHTDYRDTAFIYIGGLPFELSEGDIITIFSQYGEPNYINLVRDKETGKSKGFAFLKYEDQRSTDLAVDNLGGVTIMGRMLRVDHTRYKVKDGEEMRDNTGGDLVGGEEDDHEEDGAGKARHRRKSESEEEEDRPLLKEEKELQTLMRDHDDDDPMKEFLVQEKQEEVKQAVKAYERAQKRKNKDDHRHHKKHHHRHSRRHDDNDDRSHRRRGSGSPMDEDYRKSRHDRFTSPRRRSRSP